MNKWNKRRRMWLFLKYGGDFYCRYKGESRQREESRLSMAGRLNQTMREREEEQRRSCWPRECCSQNDWVIYGWGGCGSRGSGSPAPGGERKGSRVRSAERNHGWDLSQFWNLTILILTIPYSVCYTFWVTLSRSQCSVVLSECSRRAASLE